ncbi:trehalose-phosphatase [Phaeovulum sp. W22_SRMD_FR3]|uniref:trehalose-phosphatase n=1 Tax=Phaeovulum sp. W22_SRMD_FR3 TaxID=3240274 RepID=UPI003F959F0E
MKTFIAPPPPPDLRRAALYLDFDGTLVDIAARPEAVIVPDGLMPLLTAVHKATGGALAIVSGRGVDVLEAFLPGFPGEMIGSHGGERRGHDSPPPPNLGRLQTELAVFATAEGLHFEPKSHGGALHYRERPEAESKVLDFASTLARRSPGYGLQRAKMAVELRPAGASKDAALALLSAEAPFAGRHPYYLGDDTTDEPAIVWANAQGGTGIKIGEGETATRHHLATPTDVLAWLAAAVKGH